MSGNAQEHRQVRSELGDALSLRAREWTLIELISIFRRRRALIFGCMVGVAALAGLYCVVVTKRYQATGQIEVQKDSAGTLGLDRSVTGDTSNSAEDALDTSMTLETNVRILQSSTLALIVIKDLRLEATDDYFPAHERGLRIPTWLFFWRKPVEPLTVPLDQAPNRRYAVLKVFANHLTVESLPGTRLINVSYSSPDPLLASMVVNRLIGALREYMFQSRFQATAEASDWLSGQLASLKKQTEELQQTADRLEQGTGIYGGDASRNLVLARLDSLNGALGAAESNRILKQAVYEVAKSGDPELISGLAGNASTGVSPAMTNSLALLQTLRAEEAQVRAEIDEDNARYGSAYPKIAELHAELDAIDKSIQEEIDRIGARARTDYEIAQRAEDSAQDSFEKQKQIANEANDRTTAYELAKQEADGSRDLYQGLLAKLKEASVLEGLRSTNLTVVSPGMAPPTNRPHSPNAPLCLAAGLAGGLFLGCASALLREAADHSVRSIDDLERVLGASLLGVVPKLDQPRWFGGSRRSSSVLEVGARGLRRSFALPLWGTSSQTMLITSAIPGEGKSRLAAALAASLAHSGARVLLVDADLLRPSLHSLFGARKGSGLMEALMTQAPAETHSCTQVPGLSLVWAGGGNVQRPWEAARLMSSPHMNALMQEWRRQYDIVFLDSSPVLPVPDTASLARLCDRTLLVVRYQSTTMEAAQRSYRMIQRNLPESAALDVVMNGVPENSPDYFAYYGYKESDYERKARTDA